MLTLPTRVGPKPETNPHPPHLQVTDISPRPLHKALSDWAFSTFADVRREPTRISVRGAEALWLDEAVPAPQEVFMPTPHSREFAHVHPDGSMHLMLRPEDEKAALEAKWGELHPLHHLGVKEILVYAPRTPDELETVKTIVAASHSYVTEAA